MKRLWIGLTCMMVSAILYGSTLIAAAVYSDLLMRVDGLGWNFQYGVFGTALLEVGAFPLVLAVISGGTGIVLIALEFRKHKAENEEQPKEIEE
ncbi:phosphatase [Rossellomorea vietnamensis]|uniref:phosphatase n=1 Tax=Rossellomorea vietnamensis TaxID=218284 RepID=UPI001E658262|nr:phosphatase [Rossellomorea vietnamensis]MCC5803574.1 phosphatase [Rossellomorea vietnamensis]